jgi:hypothetical protein
MFPDAVLCYHQAHMIRPDTLQAVVLTGTRDAHNPLLTGTGLQSKVLLPVGGQPMLLSVLEALSGSRYRPQLYVSSSDPEVLALSSRIAFASLPSEERAVLSMLKSLERLPGEGWVLFASGDHALLTAEMVDYFVEAVQKQGLTFGVAVVNRREVERTYPESQRTYFPVKGAAYSGGNLFLIHKRHFQGDASFMETIDRNRKNPMRSAMLLNPWTMLQVLFRRLTLPQIAERASKVFRCHVGVVEMPFAECCMDVD